MEKIRDSSRPIVFSIPPCSTQQSLLFRVLLIVLYSNKLTLSSQIGSSQPMELPELPRRPGSHELRLPSRESFEKRRFVLRLVPFTLGTCRKSLRKEFVGSDSLRAFHGPFRVPSFLSDPIEDAIGSRRSIAAKWLGCSISFFGGVFGKPREPRRLNLCVIINLQLTAGLLLVKRA